MTGFRNQLPRAFMILLLVTGCIAGSAAAQPMAPAPGIATAPPPIQSAQWPMRFETPDGAFTVYQPQLTDFVDDKLSGRSAVALVRPGQSEPIFGAIWLESRVATDRAARTVQILDVRVTHSHFPEATGINDQALTNGLASVMSQQSPMLSLDQLLAMLEVVQKERDAGHELDNTPPRIIFRDHPAVLVQFDGAPRLGQTDAAGVLRAVNTPFFVALDQASGMYYLKGATRWFVARDVLGPYQTAPAVPPAVVNIAVTSGYQEPKQPQQAGESQAPLTAAQLAALEIVTATEPTELIWTDGPEQMSPLAGTDLLYVANTDGDVFLDIATQQTYVLVSGRWYTARNRQGPWTFVAPDALPAGFARIPPTSPKGMVLAHVANTQAARDAVADAFVPQTAAIDRNNYEQPPVQYDGQPQFQPVATNSVVSYAVNTPHSVVVVRGRYYTCYNAVWYESPVAVGPWVIATAVPEEIYTIPPSCPIYPVRYVRVYEVTPTYIYVGYLPGYVGCYRYRGVVVFGTGYHYRPWVGRVYYPRPCTYGFAARYDAYSNHWGFSVGVRVGGVSVWFGEYQRRSPVWGGWFGYGGYRPVYVHTPGQLAVYHRELAEHRAVVRREEFNVYERRHDVDRRFSPHQGAGVTVNSFGPQSQSHNNVYADPQGGVYRRTPTGSWERRDERRWVPQNDTHADGRVPHAPNSPTAPTQTPKPLAMPATAPTAPTTTPGTPSTKSPTKYAPTKTPTPTPPATPTTTTAPTTTPVQPPTTPTKPTVTERRSTHSTPSTTTTTTPSTTTTPTGKSTLNDDYRARVSGESRSRSYQSPTMWTSPTKLRDSSGPPSSSRSTTTTTPTKTPGPPLRDAGRSSSGSSTRSDTGRTDKDTKPQ